MPAVFAPLTAALRGVQIFMSAMMVLVKQLGAPLRSPCTGAALHMRVLLSCRAAAEAPTTARRSALLPTPVPICVRLRGLVKCWLSAGFGAAGRWGISVFIVLLIRSSTVLICALISLARDRINPWGNRCCPRPAGNALFVNSRTPTAELESQLRCNPGSTD